MLIYPPQPILMDRVFPFPLLQLMTSDIESVLQELALKYNSSSKNTNESIHLPRAKEHIKEVINDLLHNNEHNNDTSELARLQFILGQLENTFIPKNRRRSTQNHGD